MMPVCRVGRGPVDAVIWLCFVTWFHEELARQLQAGENPTELAETVANRAQTIDDSLDLLDYILMELDAHFGHCTPRARGAAHDVGL